MPSPPEADPELGLTLGLVAQGGFWRTAPAVVASAHVGAVGRAGCQSGFPHCRLLDVDPAAQHHRADPEASRLARHTMVAIGVVGVLLAHGAQGPLGGAFRVSIERVPGFAVMREAQKFVMLVTLAQAVGLAFGVAELLQVIPQRLRRVAPLVACLIPLLFAPATPWGLQGSLATDALSGDLGRGQPVIEPMVLSMAVLPWVHYADPGFTGWAGRRRPSPVLFRFPRALVSVDPGLAGVPFRDDVEALGSALTRRRVRRRRGDARRRYGLGWLLHLEQPPAPRPEALDCSFFTVALARPDLVLYRVSR